MDAEEQLVHEGSEGKCTDGVHEGIIQAFGVLSLTLKPETQVFGQESTFLMASQKEDD